MSIKDGSETPLRDTREGKTALNASAGTSTELDIGSASIIDDEAELRKKKIRLEIEALHFSRKYGLEILKSIAAPVAIVGFLATFIIGSLQLMQTAQNRDDERFDKAVSRLAGSKPTERLSGLAGLQLFLDSDDTSRHRAALGFLANALAVEDDDTVRNAILTALTRLKPGHIAGGDLTYLVERLRDENRSLCEQQKDAAYSYRNNAFISSVQNPGDVSEPPELNKLRATSTAITGLVRNGVQVRDLSGIYCVACDFSGRSGKGTADDGNIVHLPSVNFDNAILTGSNFIGVDLRGASFEQASLAYVDFSEANLSDTRFKNLHYIDFDIQNTGGFPIATFPDFSCAVLSRADFSGSTLIAFYANDELDQGTLEPPVTSHPDFRKADLSGAVFDNINVFTMRHGKQTPDTGHYLFDGYENLEEAISTNPKVRVLALRVKSSPRDGFSGWSFYYPRFDSHVTGTYRAGPNLRFREPFPAEYSKGVSAFVSDFAQSVNLSNSKMPVHFRSLSE